jgi:hypothetical protein
MARSLEVTAPDGTKTNVRGWGAARGAAGAVQRQRRGPGQGCGGAGQSGTRSLTTLQPRALASHPHPHPHPTPSPPTHQMFNESTIDFQSKVLARSGLGDDTYLPPCEWGPRLKDPRSGTMAAAAARLARGSVFCLSRLLTRSRARLYCPLPPPPKAWQTSTTRCRRWPTRAGSSSRCGRRATSGGGGGGAAAAGAHMKSSRRRQRRRWKQQAGSLVAPQPLALTHPSHPKPRRHPPPPNKGLLHRDPRPSQQDRRAAAPDQGRHRQLQPLQPHALPERDHHEPLQNELQHDQLQPVGHGLLR